MKKYPIVTKRKPIDSKDHGIEPTTAAARPSQLLEASGPGPFVSFRYSYTEISAAGPTARVKSKRAAYENGRLVSESFEGELDRRAYDRIAGAAQRQVAEQTAFVLRSLFAFLPLSRK